MSFEAWRSGIEQIVLERRSPDVKGEPQQHQFELALSRLWRAMHSAPRDVRDFYEDLPEPSIAVIAVDRAKALTGGAWDDWAPDLGAGEKAAVLAVAAEIRALDQALDEIGETIRTDDPERDFLSFGGEGVYILPRPLGARPAARRGQKFNRRGLLRHRILPTEIDGLTVRLRAPSVRGPGLDAGLLSLVFANAQPEIVEEEDAFRVVGHRNEAALAAALQAQLQQLGPAGAGMAAIWPELMLSPPLRETLAGFLRGRALDDDTPAIGFVVPGSWHEATEDGNVNIARVMSGVGRPLLEVVKHEKFELRPGILEDIKRGRELPVLLYGDLLIAFGICKDFCERREETPYRQLDVDLVVVPSLGTSTTMDEHKVAADTLAVGYATRAFVVQQYIPDPDGGAADPAAELWGGVLPPARRREDRKPASQMIFLDRSTI